MDAWKLPENAMMKNIDRIGGWGKPEKSWSESSKKMSAKQTV